MLQSRLGVDTGRCSTAFNTLLDALPPPITQCCNTPWRYMKSVLLTTARASLGSLLLGFNVQRLQVHGLCDVIPLTCADLKELIVPPEYDIGAPATRSVLTHTDNHADLPISIVRRGCGRCRQICNVLHHGRDMLVAHGEVREPDRHCLEILLIILEDATKRRNPGWRRLHMSPTIVTQSA